MTLNNDGISMSQLVAKMTKQQTSLKEDISTLIQESITSLQSSVNALTETITSFQAWLSATKSLTGDNFGALATTEGKIKHLPEQNVILLDSVEDLENRSERASLRILNVPEDGEKGQSTMKFVVEFLMEIMGEDVFDKPLELEQTH